MNKITNECIEQEITCLLEKGSFCHSNIEWFNELCMAMHNLSKIHRKFTKEDAIEWAKHMDPPARWTMEQTTSVMKQRGLEHDPCEFYVVMNMLVSDYGKTMAKYNMDKPEVWADLAHDFIDDPDAVSGKTGKYWRDIVDRE